MGNTIAYFIEEVKHFIIDLHICVDTNDKEAVIEPINWGGSFHLPIRATEVAHLNVHLEHDKLFIIGTSFEVEIERDDLKKTTQHHWTYELPIPSRIDTVCTRSRSKKIGQFLGRQLLRIILNSFRTQSTQH